MSEESEKQDLSALEAALTKLAPLRSNIDRDRLMFQAGRSAARLGQWMWPCTSAVLSVAVVALGATLALRPAPTPVERLIYVHVEAPSPPVGETSAPAAQPESGGAVVFSSLYPDQQSTQSEYLNLRNQVLRWGVDVLPNPVSPATSVEPLNLKELLDLPPGSIEMQKSFRRRLGQSGDHS